MAIPELNLRRIAAWCDAQTPEDMRHKMLVGAATRGNSVNIIDTREPWSDKVGPEWSRTRIAKLTRDADGDWYLHAINRNDKLLPYTADLGAGPGPIQVLEETERDPTGVFWG